jgi:hypothetical protein
LKASPKIGNICLIKVSREKTLGRRPSDEGCSVLIDFRVRFLLLLGEWRLILRLESFVSALKQPKPSPIPDRFQVVDVFAGEPRSEKQGNVFWQPLFDLNADCRLL